MSNKKPNIAVKKENNYNRLIDNIAQILEQGRKHAYSAINTILVRTYWDIGKRIIEFEQSGRQRAQYGSNLLQNLSKDLKKYGKGFSTDNLEKMRKFYLVFRNSETLSRNLSWSHYCIILRLENPLARSFYMVEAEKEKWSIRELDRQIDSMLFERIALSKDKKGVIHLSKRGQLIEKSKDLVKDPYVLEFLGLEHTPHYSETMLEQKIIDNLKEFIVEMGKGFMFVERQKRITLEDEHFYIDLVFYNRILRCFVLIELKIGKLTHKDLGQLQMYVNYYDRNIKSKDEHSTIGVLLCADKKETIVRYTLPQNNKQVFASEYKLCLPDKKILQERLRELLKKEN